jgi:hypothetical protein
VAALARTGIQADVSHSPCSRDGLARDRYSVVSTNETYFSGSGVSDAPLYRPSQSFASSMSNSAEHPPLLELPTGVLSNQRGPFRGRDASPNSTDSAGHTPPEDGWDTRQTPSSRSIPSMGDESYGGQRYSAGYVDEEQPILSSAGYSHPASPEALYAPPQMPPAAGASSRRYPEPMDYSGELGVCSFVDLHRTSHSCQLWKCSCSPHATNRNGL